MIAGVDGGTQLVGKIGGECVLHAVLHAEQIGNRDLIRISGVGEQELQSVNLGLNASQIGLRIPLRDDRSFGAGLRIRHRMFSSFQCGAVVLIDPLRSHQCCPSCLCLFSHRADIECSKRVFGGIFPVAQISNAIGQSSSCCGCRAELCAGLGEGSLGETGTLTGDFQLQIGGFTLRCCLINLFLQFDDFLTKLATSGCCVVAQFGLTRHITPDLLLLCLQLCQRIPDTLFLAVELVPFD